MAVTVTRGARVLRLLTIANLILLALLYIAENYIGERHWLTTLAAYIPQDPFAIPTVVLLLFSFARQDRRLIGLNVAAAGFFVFALLGFNVPWPSIARPDGTRVRVMTYNIHHAMAGADRVARAIREQSPDIVFLQETNGWRQYPDPIPGIQRHFPDWHVARAAEVSILSRYPIAYEAVAPLTPGTDRVILSCCVTIEGERLTLLGVHFSALRRPASFRAPKSSLADHLRGVSLVRREQAANLLRFASRVRGPVLIAGDFNTPPQGLTYRALTSRYTDAFKHAGWGLGCTYRSTLPVIRIDYILAGEGIGVRDCWVPRTRASDHRPVVADLVL